MTKDQIYAIPRKSAQEWLMSVPGGRGYEDRVLLAVEQAMNLEWWRGYHAPKQNSDIEILQTAVEHIAGLNGNYVHVAINAVATAATALHAIANPNPEGPDMTKDRQMNGGEA